MLSVIICSHNPRLKYLQATLNGLQRQTCPFSEWELLVVDNQSDEPLESKLDLKWHPRARIVQEDNLGLTPARIRGVRETVGDLLIFVDDDNVLAPDYLKQTDQISKQHPQFGAWGAGSLRPIFETPPAFELTPYLEMLALHEYSAVSWSNLTIVNASTPVGAGLCCRRTVAQRYVEMIEAKPLGASLGRRGALLISCEDTDLALTACDLGLGTAVFPHLRIEHLIPTARVQTAYLLKLAGAMAYSNVLLNSIRQADARVQFGLVRFLIGQLIVPLLKVMAKRGYAARMALARALGNYKGLVELRKRRKTVPDKR